MLLVAAIAVGVGYVLYQYILPSSGSRSAVQQSPFEEVGEAAPNATAARIARHIEVTGFRITEDPQKRTQVQFLVVNHSAAEIGDLAGTVYLRTTESDPDDPPIAQFDFEADTIGAYESIEFKTVIETSLRAYEIPDWQFLKANLEVTSPAQEG